ncbi:MAG: exodeoxyribonuclease V subunit gamma [Leptospiraceae bacterium]|nr:exodeoxyribonuclease V subunit gamma [Leptospiraceae bacterium]
MSIQLYIAGSLDLLLDRLLEEIYDEDPFLAPEIIVPNRNLRRWLQMRIAQQNGVAAHLDFQYLETGLSGILSQAAPDCELASPSMQQWALLRALQKESLNPLDHYRRASHLHYLFRDYEYHRNKLVHAWHRELKTSLTEEKGPDIFELEDRHGLSLKEDENLQEQKRIYCSMLSLLHAHGLRTLTELSGHALSSGSFMQRPLYVFGLSRMSRLHLSILFRLSLHFPVNIYLFDVFGDALGGGAGWQNVQPPLFSESLEDNALLVGQRRSEEEYGFQRDGLELLYLLRLGQEFLNENGHSLHWLVHSRGTGILPWLKEKQKKEPVVTLLEAPGMRQEVETIHDDILLKLAADSSLQPGDFAILVPSMQRYRAHFEYVFRGRDQLPFNLTDFSARETSRLGDVVRTLLRFEQPLDRRTVFHLLSNPVIREKWRLQPEDYAELLQKADELNMFRGSHDSAFVVHTWQHGLRRLRLAEVMVGQETYQGYLPAASGIRRPELYALLSDFVHHLEDFRRQFQSSGKPFQALRQMMDGILTVEGSRQESNIYLSILQAIQSGEEHCRRLGISPDPLLVREWILESMKEVSGGIGEYLIQGVTISALQPMRPIPFRHLYIAGLKEGDFPGFPLAHPEDLRRQYRLPGDSSVPDGNRFLFLEALASFQDTLTLSYVSRDLARDDEFQPSSVILELQELLDLTAARHTVPTTWLSRRYASGKVLDPLHRRVLQERWQEGQKKGNCLPEAEGKDTLQKTSYRAHQVARLFGDPMRAFLEFRLNAHPLRQEDLSDVSDEPFRLMPSLRSNLRYRLLDILPHFCGRQEDLRNFLLQEYDRQILSGGAPAAFFAELDRNELEKTLPLESMSHPEFLELASPNALLLSSQREQGLDEFPFVGLRPPCNLNGLKFHFTIPWIQPELRRILIPTQGKPGPEKRKDVFLNILFYMLSIEKPLNHEVYFLNFSGEGSVEGKELLLSLDEMKELAAFILDELQTYGPLLFPEAISEAADEIALEQMIPELLLDTWQSLQESGHPVLGMVMEKMDTADLLSLMLPTGGEKPEQFEILTRRLTMRGRLAEVWK